MSKTFITFFLFFYASVSWGKLNIVATTPDVAWLVKKIGGNRVQVTSLLDGSEDPHFADAMPSWILKAARADIFCQVGLELEVGWAPKVLSRSGNKKVQPGGKGFCDLGKFVQALEVPKGKVNRSMGDVHASGNPHYLLGPEQFKRSADGVFEILLNNDPQGLTVYDKNLRKLKARINKTKKVVAKILKGHRKVNLMSYHKEFSYFIKDFALSYKGDIEEVPGVPPSAGRIARVALDAKRSNIKLVLASSTNPKKLLEKFKEISGVPYIQVPVSMRTKGKPASYSELLIGIAKAIVKGQ